MVEIVLTWISGKRQLLPDILSLFPFIYQKLGYHEPFVRCGVGFFKIRPRSGSISDINSRMMNFFELSEINPKI